MSFFPWMFIVSNQLLLSNGICCYLRWFCYGCFENPVYQTKWFTKNLLHPNKYVPFICLLINNYASHFGCIFELWKFDMKSGQHCVKFVQIRSFFWSIFPRIQSDYGKTWTRKNSVFGHFLHSAVNHFVFVNKVVVIIIIIVVFII